MAAKFYQRSVTLSNNKTLTTKFFIADPMDFCIEPTTKASAKQWGDEGAFGTNASFFMRQANGTAYMTALHIFRNKDMSQYPGNAEGGSQNCEKSGDTSTAMDIIYCNGSTKKAGLLQNTASWSTSNNHGVSNMEWGIGGFNVLTTKTFASKDAFDTGIRQHYPNLYYGQLGTPTSRTAIGVRSDGSVILVAAFGSNIAYPTSNGPTVYEIHLLMKYFGCSYALCLEGSDCTKISFKKTNGSVDAVLNGSRLCYCRMRLLVAAANSCDWSGK